MILRSINAIQPAQHGHNQGGGPLQDRHVAGLVRHQFRRATATPASISAVLAVRSRPNIIVRSEDHTGKMGAEKRRVPSAIAENSYMRNLRPP